VINRVQLGSPQLVPEIATTKTGGVVLTPSFAPGLGFSIDYYDTVVKQAIALISANTVPDLCYQNMQRGSTTLCDWLTWDPNAGAPFSPTGVITQARQGNFNQASQRVRGVDVEASYHFSLDKIAAGLPGELALRVIGTRALENYTDDGNPNTLEFETVNVTVPKLRLNNSVEYSVDRFTGGLTMRYFSGTVSGSGTARSIQCTSGCPVSTTVQTTYDNIYTKPTAKYFDLSLSWSLDSLLGMESGSRVFFNVKNLLDKDPPLVPAVGGAASLPYIYSRTSASNAQYDILGREFRLGVDFKF
jgi:outer membrane receptor protein involved in Fe transport